MASLHAFIDNSLLVASWKGQIKYLCTKCYNRFWTLSKNVENHLKYDGMVVYYLHAPWKWHGEPLPLPRANMEEPLAANVDVLVMPHDAFNMHGLCPSPNDDEEFVSPQGLPTRYRKILLFNGGGSNKIISWLWQDKTRIHITTVPSQSLKLLD